MKNLIYTSFSPNTRAKDLLVNVMAILSPFNYKKGPYADKIKSWFCTKFNHKNVFTFNYARSGMYILFKTLKFNDAKTTIQKDEIVLQGLTCVAAVNPIIWAGYKPVFCDIDPNTLTMSLEELKKVVTKRTRAVMYQNTFGNSAHIEEVAKYCKENNLTLIEDSTHTIGGSHNGKLIGSFGDASIFSFGRDKAISGVDGGVIVINNDKLVETFSKEYKTLNYPSTKWILQELLFPIIWTKVKLTYTIQLGKAIHLLATKLHLLARATTPEEKAGKISKEIPALLPNSLARLAWTQLQDIDAINAHRNDIAKKYANLIRQNQDKLNMKFIKFEKGNYLLRLPLRVSNQKDLMNCLQKKYIFLGDWYNTPVAPQEVKPEIVGYKFGSCPIAEKVCEEIINLPTHINTDDKNVEYIIYAIMNTGLSDRE